MTSARAGAACAEHIGQSQVARSQQRSVNQAILDLHSSAREKEIIAWLAPTNYDVDYYKNDLANARDLRHPKTCEWVFSIEELTRLLGPAHTNLECHVQDESLLWIYARPGLGKTIVVSRLIDFYKSEDKYLHQYHLFYFFCKNSDTDKITSLSYAVSPLPTL